MAAGDRKTFSKQLVALFAGATLLSYSGSIPEVFAQENSTPGTFQPKVADGQKLVLSANELIYNKDEQVVSVIGGVQINYAGYKLVAQRVDYNQKTGRMMALGNIEMISPDGNRMYSDKLDVTDDFANGFVDALRIETPDNTRIVAESAERVGGTQMILNKGVYTACLPCAEKPEKAPFWQVKSQRVIQNGEKHTIRLEHARLELLGMPIAYLPWIEVPDNTVKRKSGWASFYAANEIDNRPGFVLILYGIPIATSLISIILLNLHLRVSVLSIVGGLLSRTRRQLLPGKNRNSGGAA